MSKFSLKGKFITINEYSQLVVRIDDESLAKLNDLSISGKKPWYTSDEGITTVKLKVPNWKKNEASMEAFDDLVGGYVKVSVKASAYDFTDKETKKQITGTTLVIKHMNAIEAPIEAKQVTAKLTAKVAVKKSKKVVEEPIEDEPEETE